MSAYGPRELRVLLPAHASLDGRAAGLGELRRRLARADRLPDVPPGRGAQLQQALGSDPRRWPAAALTRDLDCGDAVGASWLRADPARIGVELTSTRLLAVGAELAVDDALRIELEGLLRPMFGDAGMEFSAPTPWRWYLRIDDGRPLPQFAPPWVALGARLDTVLADGHEARRWMALLNEAQMSLHQKPAARAVGLNSLWFWGAGRLPGALPALDWVLSDDALLLGLAKARARPGLRPEECGELSALPLRGLALIDLADAGALARALPQALACSSRAALTRWLLADGARYCWRPAHRWRFWRRG